MDVDHDNARVFPVGDVAAFVTGMCQNRAVAIRGQRELQQVSDLRLVVNDETLAIRAVDRKEVNGRLSDCRIVEECPHNRFPAR